MRYCPVCNKSVESATGHVGDAPGGDVLISTFVEYCPELDSTGFPCLHIFTSKVELST